MAETLGNLTDVLRGRRQLKRKIRALSSEAKASAYIIGSLPFIMTLLIYLVNSEYITGLFADPRGQVTRSTFDYQHEANLPTLVTLLGQTEVQVRSLLDNAGMALTGGVSGQISGNIVHVDKPSVTLADGSTQTIMLDMTYNDFGQVTSLTDAEGIVSEYQYYPENDPDGDGIVSETLDALRTLSGATGGYRSHIIRDATG